MADIQIHRAHAFGLTRARAIALSWAEELEERYGMDCTIHEGDDSDTVTFVRDGVNGSLEVAGDSFELQVRLGFLLSAFRKQIETEVARVLDALLAKEAGAVTKTRVKTTSKLDALASQLGGGGKRGKAKAADDASDKGGAAKPAKAGKADGAGNADKGAKPAKLAKPAKG